MIFASALPDFEKSNLAGIDTAKLGVRLLAVSQNDSSNSLISATKDDVPLAAAVKF